MIVSVLNTKGGVGKTTLAINLAIYRVLMQRRVLIVNGDRQPTLTQAIAQRAAGGFQPPVDDAHIFDGPDLHAHIQTHRGSYDDIVIDAGGRDNSALRAALMLSDVIVVPFQPRSFDVWGVSDMSEISQEALAIRPAVRVLAVLNAADPAGTDNDDAAAAIADLPTLTYLNTPIVRRKAIAEAAASGRSVIEVRGDDKARGEMIAFVTAVFHN